jgi:glycosyltransferase involved in cell wall biosynthesis
MLLWFGSEPQWLHGFLEKHRGLICFRPPSRLLPGSNLAYEDLLLCLKARGTAYPLWDFPDFQEPLFLYLGPIGDSSIDWGALESLAAENPEATIALISSQPDGATDPRTRVPAIQYLGARPPAQWYLYLSRANLLIAPLANTPGVEDVVYDVMMSYVAAGKPILATSAVQLANFADVPNARFSDPTGFGKAASQALRIVPDLDLGGAYMQSKSPNAVAEALLAKANNQLCRQPLNPLPSPKRCVIEGPPSDTAELARGLRDLGYDIPIHETGGDQADFDILIADSPYRGAELAWRRGVPVVGRIDATHNPAANLFITRYIARSLTAARHFCRTYNIAPSKITAIPHGIDPDRPLRIPGITTRPTVGLTDKDYVVLQAAPIAGPNAQIHSIAAVEALRERCPNLKLILAGCVTNRQYAAEVSAYIEGAGLQDRVMLGSDTTCLNDYYHLADAFLLTSVIENATTPALEALSFGLPLLLTNAGGAPDLIDGNGILIPAALNSADVWELSTSRQPDNLEALANALLEMYNHPQEWRDRGQLGRTKIRERFDIRCTCASYAREIDSLLMKHGVNRS